MPLVEKTGASRPLRGANRSVSGAANARTRVSVVNDVACSSHAVAARAEAGQRDAGHGRVELEVGVLRRPLRRASVTLAIPSGVLSEPSSTGAGGGATVAAPLTTGPST